ncbi:MAG: lipoyl(octanoyl) transferase LipB [Chloroflexota bacterium]
MNEASAKTEDVLPAGEVGQWDVVPWEIVEVVRPGLIAYEEAWNWQRTRAEAVRAGTAAEAVALLQHTPVYTLGMRGRTASMLMTDEEAAALGAAVVQSDRGGDVTFHGPGQLVAYGILDTRARNLRPASVVNAYIQSTIETVARFGIEAECIEGRPGVWVRDATGYASKIAAVGVRIRNGITTHGVALNVTTDLSWFDHIVPCGIADAGVTSIQSTLGEAPPLATVEAELLSALSRMFHVKQFVEARYK